MAPQRSAAQSLRVAANQNGSATLRKAFASRLTNTHSLSANTRIRWNPSTSERLPRVLTAILRPPQPVMRCSSFHLPSHTWAPLPAADEVHLWTAAWPRLEAWGDLTACLTPEEHTRAERFRVARARDQFILGRAWLRRLLGAYLDIEPSRIVLTYEATGKPVLAGAAGGQPVHFNLSHSGELVVIAVSGGGRVGVDVEQRKCLPEVELLVQRFFSPGEHTAFAALPVEERLPSFFRAWVRKEAALKATGSGITVLDDCDVTFRRDDPPRLLRLGDDEEASWCWWMHAWQPAEDYEAAVVVECRSGEWGVGSGE